MIPALPLLLLAAGAAPTFELHSARDDWPAGTLVRLDATSVQVAGAAPVPFADLIALHRPGVPPPHFPHDRPHLLFVNGDRWPGQPVSIASDRLRVRADLGQVQEFDVPLSALAAVWFTPRAAARAAGPDGRRLLDETRPQDVVWLANQDTARGTVTTLADGGPLTLDGGATVPRDRLQAVLLNSALARGLRPRGPYAQLVLRNGARLSLKTVTLEGADLVGETLFGAAAKVPLAEVVAVNTRQGKAVYLSDLSPRRYEHTAYLGVPWPLAADRSVQGLDLRLAGGTYDKGLGLHSRSRVTYALPPRARRFEALVGLDEATGRRGSAGVQVLADDVPLLNPAPKLSAGPPRPLRLALPPRARTVTLVVEFGDGGAVQDDVDWADARIVVGG